MQSTRKRLQSLDPKNRWSAIIGRGQLEDIRNSVVDESSLTDTTNDWAIVHQGGLLFGPEIGANSYHISVVHTALEELLDLQRQWCPQRTIVHFRSIFVPSTAWKSVVAAEKVTGFSSWPTAFTPCIEKNAASIHRAMKHLDLIIK